MLEFPQLLPQYLLGSSPLSYEFHCEIGYLPTFLSPNEARPLLSSKITSCSSQPPTHTMLCAPMRLPPPGASAGPAEAETQGLAVVPEERERGRLLFPTLAVIEQGRTGEIDSIILLA